MTHLPTPGSPVASVVTVASPVTTAKNPLAVDKSSVCSLTVMVVPVTGPGVEPQETQELQLPEPQLLPGPQYRWVEVPAVTSTQS